MSIKTINTISPSKIFGWLVVVSLLIFAYYINIKAGERGFLQSNQSFVFDGGYRIISGQIPYKDFIIPFGPITFWIQGIFFKLLGVNYLSFIYSASFFNVLATICSFAILKLFFPRQDLLSYIAGLLTAIWFYPPFGTTYPENTAFFFSLAALTFIIGAIINNPDSARSSLLVLISGCLASLSFISKQNVGLLILPLYFLLITAAYLPDLRRVRNNYVVFSSGIILIFAVFYCWVALHSDLKTFLRYFFELPAKCGHERFSRIFSSPSRSFLAFYSGKRLNRMPPMYCVIFMRISFLISLAVFFREIFDFIKIKKASKKLILASILCIYLVLFQNIFISTSLTESARDFPFLGLIFAIAVGSLFQLTAKEPLAGKAVNHKTGLINRNIFNVILVTLLCLSSSYIAICGIRVALRQSAHVLCSGSGFPAYMKIDKLKNLRWGQPTRSEYYNLEVKEEDFVNLYEYLKAEKKNIFIFPDFTIFYALLNVPSPQPILWFHRGQTYPEAYDQNLDNWIVDDLIKNRVELVVLEEKYLFSQYLSLDDFPRLKTFIQKNFVKTHQIGIFNIFKKRYGDFQALK